MLMGVIIIKGNKAVLELLLITLLRNLFHSPYDFLPLTR